MKDILKPLHSDSLVEVFISRFENLILTGKIALALSEFDPDHLMAGGYCTGDGEGYWNKLVASAGYTI